MCQVSRDDPCGRHGGLLVGGVVIIDTDFDVIKFGTGYF